MRDLVQHLPQADGSVGGAEQVPGLGGGQPRGPAEEPAADDPVVRRVRLEEERLAWPQSPEPAAAWPPEVDLAEQVRPVREQPVPAVVRHPDKPPHPAHAGIVLLLETVRGRMTRAEPPARLQAMRRSSDEMHRSDRSEVDGYSRCTCDARSCRNESVADAHAYALAGMLIRGSANPAVVPQGLPRGLVMDPEASQIGRCRGTAAAAHRRQ